jgi:hypothetical protein
MLRVLLTRVDLEVDEFGVVVDLNPSQDDEAEDNPDARGQENDEQSIVDLALSHQPSS